MVYVNFVEKVQSNSDYYKWGKPSPVGEIEKLLAYFGLDFELSHFINEMHLNNLRKLEYFIDNNASDEQLAYISQITTKGTKIPEPSIESQSSEKVFISMPMNKTLYNDVEDIRNSINEAVKNTNNIPYFLDKDPHNDNISIKMLQEIRDCKFLVAEFSYQNNGVYYEAGYAKALGKTVIFTCSRKHFENIHFDIKQTQFVIWENYDSLKENLKKQIIESNLS